MKKLTAIILSALMALSLTACGGSGDTQPAGENEKSFKIGICNYVDDASLNQIVANIEDELETIGAQQGVNFEIMYDNCNANANDMAQIIANFQADGVDLMVGVATPVAMTMQGMEENLPIVFAAVSDPVSVGLVDSLENPGANITGTSDFLDTTSVLNLIFALNPNAQTIALLYDAGQDSSTTAISTAKSYLADKGVKVVDYTGSNNVEIEQIVDSIIADGADAIFTPSDNTVMTAELAIYEKMAKAGIPHYAGADSFALNGAFCGYGVDYRNLGRETGKMIADILVNGKDVSTMSVKTFDNGTATINTEICAEMGLDFEEVKSLFAPLCQSVQEIKTADSFDDLK